MGRFSSWMNSAANDFEGWSRWLTKLFRQGVASGLTVTQRALGANMSVDIQVGDAAPMSTNTAAWSWATAVENLAVDAASVTNRRDLVVFYTDLSVTNPSTATPNNPGSFKMIVVKGTPAASPSDPDATAIQAAVGAGNPYIVRARISLTSSTTQITNAQITNFDVPMALNVQRLWGGGGNTLGHQVPNVADAYLALTTRSDGKISFAELLSTIFSGQVTTYTNPGSGGGTFYYVNLGGIKLFWGKTASVAITGSGNQSTSKVVTYPAGFFTTIQSIKPSVDVVLATEYLMTNISSRNDPTSVTLNLVQTNGINGSAPIDLLVIGT